MLLLAVGLRWRNAKLHTKLHGQSWMSGMWWRDRVNSLLSVLLRQRPAFFCIFDVVPSEVVPAMDADVENNGDDNCDDSDGTSDDGAEHETGDEVSEPSYELSALENAPVKVAAVYQDLSD